MMRTNAVLPERCIKCNAPAEGGRIKVRLRWNEPADFPYFFGIRLRSFTDRTARIEVCLCKKHRLAKRLAFARGGLLFILGLALTLIVMSHEVISFKAPPWLALIMVSIGIALLGAGLIELCFMRPVTPHKINKEFVWLKHVDTNYLAQFPPIAD